MISKILLFASPYFDEPTMKIFLSVKPFFDTSLLRYVSVKLGAPLRGCELVAVRLIN